MQKRGRRNVPGQPCPVGAQGITVQTRHQSRWRLTQICSVTDSSGCLGCGKVLEMKSAPMVARYAVEKRPEMYCTSRQDLGHTTEIWRDNSEPGLGDSFYQRQSFRSLRVSPSA